MAMVLPADDLQTLRRPREQGFTLLETLITLALLSLTLTLIAGSIGYATRALNEAKRRERVMPVAIVLDFLRNQLLAAKPELVGDQKGAPQLAFSGGENDLWLVNSFEGETTRSGLYLLHFELGAAGPTGTANGSKTLWLSLFPFDANAGLEALPTVTERRALIQNVADVRFRYFGLSNTDSKVDWSKAWVNEPSLPQLIDMAIDFAATDQRQSTELVVAPRLSFQ